MANFLKQVLIMKVLIFTASTGGGHKRAAAAIEAKIREISPETEVSVVDGMRAIGRFYNKSVCTGYYIMATKTPEFYGQLYKITDRQELAARAVMKSNENMSRKLLEVISKHAPDVIIICHAFIGNMVSRLKAKGKLTTQTILLITDYDAHRTYISPNIDAFVIPQPQMKQKLVETFGVDENKIYALGIPTLDRFTEKADRAEICARERLNPDKPTVLLMAGSFGVTGVLKFYQQLVRSEADIQMIVITGRNIRLFDHFQRKIEALDSKSSTKLLYFVDNVEDYMHVSDLIVTKPGGLTVTESIACELPMAIYSAFPGQERENAEFLVSQNAAILIEKDVGAAQIVALLNSPERLQKMRESCRNMAQPNAAEHIFRLAVQLCSPKQLPESAAE